MLLRGKYSLNFTKPETPTFLRILHTVATQEISEKQTFLTPWYAHVGKTEMMTFRKICVRIFTHFQMNYKSTEARKRVLHKSEVTNRITTIFRIGKTFPRVS